MSLAVTLSVVLSLSHNMSIRNEYRQVLIARKVLYCTGSVNVVHVHQVRTPSHPCIEEPRR